MKSLKLFLAGVCMIVLTIPTITAADTKPVQEPDEIIQAQPTIPAEKTSNPTALGRPVSPQAFQLNWLSINGGGAINASSTNYQLGLSVGQSVAGFATSSSYQMGIGFWYGAAAGAPACGAAKGDLNGVGGLSPADAILMLNCAFLLNGAGTVGGDCNLCYTDMNCVGGLTPADVIIEMNYVFLAIAPPC